MGEWGYRGLLVESHGISCIWDCEELCSRAGGGLYVKWHGEGVHVSLGWRCISVMSRVMEGIIGVEGGGILQVWEAIHASECQGR